MLEASTSFSSSLHVEAACVVLRKLDVLYFFACYRRM